MNIFQSLPNSIGNTPLIQLNNLCPGSSATILAKLESANPLGSVKDRVAQAMIKAGEEHGLIRPDTVIIEATSGNTGIGLASICASRNYRLILTMPETMSLERRKLLVHLGAELVLTPGSEGMKGAIARARTLCAELPDAFMPNQFENPANPAIHCQTTAQEIWEDTDGTIDIFIAGVGTGGTITGVSETIKVLKPELLAIGIEPADSPVLSGGQPGPHKIQGIGAGFIPKILNTAIIDEMITVSNDNAMATARLVAVREGILCGISSGAALWGALEIAARKEHQGKTIVVILPDTGERYLSTELLQEASPQKG